MGKITFAALAAVSVLASCSIKEDRSGCPCLLRLDFSQVPLSGRTGDMLLSVTSEDGFASSDTIDMASVPEIYEISVPRSGVYVNLWSEEAADFIGDEGLVIPLGEDCPAVRMFSSHIDTGCETCTETVYICKNYCGLTVTFSGKPESPDEDIFRFDVGVRGGIDGYGIDGSPREGIFSHYLLSDEAGGDRNSRRLSLPRQTDSSLLLDISEDASVLKTFALGNYIEKSGYDWTARELEDISVEIDYACTKMRIAIGSWDRSYDFDVVF